MDWIIPGTTLTAPREAAAAVKDQFAGMFLAGGLTLSQVAAVSGLEPYTIQNWVKRGFLPSPRGKRYDMDQLCRILNMNVLRGNTPLEQIVRLMSYLNGDLADERDDLVDDSALYFYFVRLASCVDQISADRDWDEVLEKVTQDYEEPVLGARQKLSRVLQIMITVWLANTLKARAEAMIADL